MSRRSIELLIKDLWEARDLVRVEIEQKLDQWEN